MFGLQVVFNCILIDVWNNVDNGILIEYIKHYINSLMAELDEGFEFLCVWKRTQLAV